MSYNEEHVQAPGKLITSTTVVLGLIVLTALAIIGYRYVMGIGAVSNLSDGYPWGVWLAYDVAVGSAFACGGYVLAITVYIMNKFKYHPMMRSAVLASMFGYALAGLSVMVDIGRYWNAYGFFMPSRWQTNSVMFEVAVCIMAYTVVLIIEFTPSVLEKLAELKSGFWSNFAKAVAPKLDKVLIFIIALGVVLPTMHQSSLGSLFIIAGDKLHPLWQTGLTLPLLFLFNAVLLGFSIVVFESSLSSVGFKRPYEKETLDVAKIIPYIAIIWLVFRCAEIIYHGKIGHLFTSGLYSMWFWAEILLIVAGIFMLLGRSAPRKAFYGALLVCLGAGLYRMNVYIIGYDPGPQWTTYFPSVAEFFITLGIVAIEVLAYIILARVLKLLPKPHAAH